MTGRASIVAVLLLPAGCGGTGATTAASPAELAAGESYVRRSINDPEADVVAGYGPTMPRLPLDESEVDLLVEWVRSLE